MRIGLSRNERATRKEWSNKWRTDADSDSIFSTCDSRRCNESQAEVTLRKSTNGQALSQSVRFWVQPNL